MRKLGITLPHLGGTQIGLEVFESVTALYSENWTTDVVLFYETILGEAFDWPCACYPTIDLLGYDGPVVATTVAAAEELAKVVTIPKKYFYVFDIPKQTDKNFNDVAKVYRDSRLTLIARSHEYARYLSNAFNVKVKHVMEKFRIEGFPSG